MRGLDILKLHLFVLHNTSTISFPLFISRFLRYNKQFFSKLQYDGKIESVKMKSDSNESNHVSLRQMMYTGIPYGTNYFLSLFFPLSPLCCRPPFPKTNFFSFHKTTKHWKPQYVLRDQGVFFLYRQDWLKVGVTIGKGLVRIGKMIGKTSGKGLGTNLYVF